MSVIEQPGIREPNVGLWEDVYGPASLHQCEQFIDAPPADVAESRYVALRLAVGPYGIYVQGRQS